MKAGVEAVCVPHRCHGRGMGPRPPVPARVQGGLRLADAQPAGGVRRLPLSAARGLRLADAAGRLAALQGGLRPGDAVARRRGLRSDHRRRARTDPRGGGRSWSPSAAVLDSRTLKSTASSEGAAYDGAKRVKGRKLHLVVDTLGHLLAAVVSPADAQDRAVVAELCAQMQAEVAGTSPRPVKCRAAALTASSACLAPAGSPFARAIVRRSSWVPGGDAGGVAGHQNARRRTRPGMPAGRSHSACRTH